MAKFLFVYRSDKDTFDTMATEELQRFHQKWQTWMAEGLQKGWMLDASTALKTEGRVVNAKKVVADGPMLALEEQFFVDPFNVFLVALTAFVGFTTSLF